MERYLVQITLDVLIENKDDTIIKVTQALKSAQNELDIHGYGFKYYPSIEDHIDAVKR